MSLKQIMGILIASMLVFLPFVLMFNPIVLEKYRKKHMNDEENTTDIQDSTSENNQQSQNENFGDWQ